MAYGFNNPPQNNNFPTNTQTFAPPPATTMPQQNIQPLFPQPQGNVYTINSTLEVANVPVGAGVSVALCMPENVMFIKTMQNGNPLFYPYKILPYANETSNDNAPKEEKVENTSLAEQLENCKERITVIENKLNKKKGVDLNI